MGLTGGWTVPEYAELGCLIERPWLLQLATVTCEARLVSIGFSERADEEVEPDAVEVVLLVPGAVNVGVLVHRFDTGAFGIEGESIGVSVSLVKGPAAEWISYLVDRCDPSVTIVPFDGNEATM